MKNHYDVCIAGFWYGANYGSLLNGYSMYRIFKDCGKEVLMLQKPGAKIDDPEINKGHNVNFIKKYYDHEDVSPVLSYSQLPELNKYCDCFCAGSDQIWNYNLSFHENMFLPFVDKNKKLISFSTSFGHKQDSTPEKAKQRVKEHLQRFSAISVREQFDVDILRDNYGINGTLLFEPVFCIDKKYYQLLADNASFHEDKPYLLTYILDPTPEKREAIKYYGEKTGLKVINMLNGVEEIWGKNKEILDLPNTIENVEAEDFLKAFLNASYVITDSFHGCAFSIIFNKPFLAIGNYGRGYERFIDLLGRLDLLDRLISDPKRIPHDERFLKAINYKNVNKIIEGEARKTVEWVKNAIETPKEKMTSILIPNRAITAVLNKELCMGCSACVSICPTGALKLREDDYGYYKSTIEGNKCINCGRCSQICPALALPHNTNDNKPSCYEFIANNEQVLKNSSSGGVFPIMAKEVFRRSGYVVGAAWGNNFTVEHIMIDDIGDLPKIQKSKYLQSYLGNTFKKIQDKLNENNFVLFSGCPCQVAGLKAFLGKEYDNLILIDILCSYAPSPMFFKKYLEDTFQEKLEDYQFRYKSEQYGWDCVTVKVKLCNGEEIVHHGGIQDDYQRVFHNHVMCSKHCEKCKYQTAPRLGDVTIGDFWGIEQKDYDINTKRGVSVVLCNNKKGYTFLKSLPIQEINVLKEVPLTWLGGNGYVINNSHNYSSPVRDLFYSAIKTMKFSDAVNYALKPNHGIYEDIYKISNTPLQYDASFLRFQYDRNVWEEHLINGKTVLMVKQGQSRPGRYAKMPLCKPLKKGKRYLFTARFSTKTKSKIINFHIKDSGSGYYQIIYSFKKQTDESKTNEVRVEFVPNSNIYDEFMIGAAQMSGPDNYIAFDFINISEY